MSCNYTRVYVEEPASKLYGYQKVSAQDMKSLIMRMQKPTHSSDMGGYFPDGYFKHPHRPTSGLCKRATPDSEQLASLTSTRKRRMSPKQTNQLLRRLQTPTLSRMVAEGVIAPDYERPSTSGAAARRLRTEDEKSKFLRRITRPTTASKRRDMDTYWEEATASEYYDLDFSADQSAASKDEIDTIVDRVRAPTVSSDSNDVRRCPKRRQSVHVDRDKLPLVSGLARTKRVSDIVERLYRPTSSVSRSGSNDTSQTTESSDAVR